MFRHSFQSAAIAFTPIPFAGNARAALLTVVYLISIVGSLILFFAAFTRCGRLASHLTRVALWLVASLLVTRSMMGLLSLSLSLGVDSRPENSWEHFGTIIEGMGLGILLLLLISGELYRVFSAAKHNQRKFKDRK